MASSYDNDLRLEEQASGENSTSWGDKTNNNLELIAEAFGYGTENLGSDANTTITIADGSADAARSLYLKITSTTLTATREVTLAPNSVSKVWIIENATTGSQSITIKQGSGATVTIANGQVKAIATDGAGSGAAVYDLFQDLAVPDLFVDDDLTLQSDGAVINFGADSDVSLIHQADSGLMLSAGANATQLTLYSTDAGATVGPTINLTRDSGSPADDDRLGYINFIGDDSGGNSTSYVQMFAAVTDVTDTEEDSEFYINTVKAGSAANNLIVRNDSVAFKVNNTVTNNQGFAENTAMLFYQSSAPTGWTKSTANNDKALRVVSGSGGSAGGSVAFSTAFASQAVSGTVGSTTLTISQIPSHNHTIRGSTVASGSAAFSASNGSGTSTGLTGGGGSHNHSFSGSAINLAVQYCDVIICTKDA